MTHRPERARSACQQPSVGAPAASRATPEVVGPGSQGAIPTPRLVSVLGGTGVDSTLCGHLPKFVARRVRSRLPPPPPSPAGARAPGSRRSSSPFFSLFRLFPATSSDSPGRHDHSRNQGAGRCPEIVSRAVFRGPGWALLGHRPRTADLRSGARPTAVARYRVGTSPHNPISIDIVTAAPGPPGWTPRRPHRRHLDHALINQPRLYFDTARRGGRSVPQRGHVPEIHPIWVAGISRISDSLALFRIKTFDRAHGGCPAPGARVRRLQRRPNELGLLADGPACRQSCVLPIAARLRRCCVSLARSRRKART